MNHLQNKPALDKPPPVPGRIRFEAVISNQNERSTSVSGCHASNGLKP